MIKERDLVVLEQFNYCKVCVPISLAWSTGGVASNSMGFIPNFIRVGQLVSSYEGQINLTML
jgi:hypothetical protein